MNQQIGEVFHPSSFILWGAVAVTPLDTIPPTDVLLASEYGRLGIDACPGRFLPCLAKEGAMDINKWFNDDRLLANLIGVHIALAAILIASIVFASCSRLVASKSSAGWDCVGSAGRA